VTLDPKPISRAGVPAALQKAERYRLINDPSSAESICIDVLQVDQFDQGPTEGVRRARELLPRLQDEYKRAYYAGIVCERCAKAQLRPQTPGSGERAYHWLTEAMGWYEKAEARRPAGNDEAILRWNTCARMLSRNEQLRPGTQESAELGLE
jgi:hypothetical protein